MLRCPPHIQHLVIMWLKFCTSCDSWASSARWRRPGVMAESSGKELVSEPWCFGICWSQLLQCLISYLNLGSELYQAIYVTFRSGKLWLGFSDILYTKPLIEYNQCSLSTRSIYCQQLMWHAFQHHEYGMIVLPLEAACCDDGFLVELYLCSG